MRLELGQLGVFVTVSAVLSMPSALASSVIAQTIALAPGLGSKLWMKLRSILNLAAAR